MNPPPRKLDDESQQLINEWLKNNKPTQCKTYARTDAEDVEYKNSWGKRKSK